MISENTRILGSLASAYFNVKGWDISIDTDMFFQHVQNIVNSPNFEDTLQSHIQSRMFLLADFIAGCIDFPDVGRCERRRDRLYGIVEEKLQESLNIYVSSTFGVSFHEIWERINYLDGILDKAISIYLAGRVDVPSDAIQLALQQQGKNVFTIEDGISVLLDVIKSWFGDNHTYVEAFAFVLIVLNYAMGYLLTYLEEWKSGE